MPAAKYREPITISKPAANPTKDALGHATPTWETHTTLFAEIVANGSNEFRKLGITRAEVTHAVCLRYSPTAITTTSSMRIIRADGAVLAIASLPRDPDGRRRELIIETIQGAM